jgi:hypothetical protein
MLLILDLESNIQFILFLYKWLWEEEESSVSIVSKRLGFRFVILMGLGIFVIRVLSSCS